MKFEISKAEINEKPLLEYPGDIDWVRDEDQAAELIKVFATESLLGFDTETRPTFKKGQHYPPTLLQLAGEERVAVFQLRFLGNLTPLFELLATKEITKAGVAVSRDVEELKDLHSFAPAGFQDVGHMAQKRGFKNTGLRPLTALLLEHRISKGAQVSNWAAQDLSEKQLRYAATDAWISRQLYQKILPLPKIKH